MIGVNFGNDRGLFLDRTWHIAHDVSPRMTDQTAVLPVDYSDFSSDG
jgi:hypothetical protein